MAKQVLVTRASGLVGSHLAEALETRGHSALAMTRHPDTYSGAEKPISGDAYEPASLNRSAASCENQLIIVRIDSDRAALKPLPKLLVPLRPRVGKAL